MEITESCQKLVNGAQFWFVFWTFVLWFATYVSVWSYRAQAQTPCWEWEYGGKQWGIIIITVMSSTSIFLTWMCFRTFFHPEEYLAARHGNTECIHTTKEKQ